MVEILELALSCTLQGFAVICMIAAVAVIPGSIILYKRDKQVTKGFIPLVMLADVMIVPVFMVASQGLLMWAEYVYP